MNYTVWGGCCLENPGPAVAVSNRSGSRRTGARGDLRSGPRAGGNANVVVRRDSTTGEVTRVLTRRRFRREYPGWKLSGAACPAHPGVRRGLTGRRGPAHVPRRSTGGGLAPRHLVGGASGHYGWAAIRLGSPAMRGRSSSSRQWAPVHSASSPSRAESALTRNGSASPARLASW